jgi:hypothetical protein
VSGDGAGRCHEVALAQRNLLGTAGRATRVQDQGHIVGAAALECRGGPHRLPGRQQLRRPAAGGLYGEHRGRHGRSRRSCGSRPACRGKQRLGRYVLEIERELQLGVRGIERGSRGAERGGCQDEQDEVGTARQGKGDAIPAPDSRFRQVPRIILGPVARLLVGQ